MAGTSARPAPAGAAGAGRRTAPAWPLFCGLGPLGALPTAPRMARTFTVLVLGGWGLGGAAEAGELIISELTTNVVQAAAGPDGRPAYGTGGLPLLWLRLMAGEALLGIEVWDNLPAASSRPALRQPAADAEFGRGLAIVADLSLDWGWEPVPGQQAKRVWAVIAAR